jgi:hypothetical protein
VDDVEPRDITSVHEAGHAAMAHRLGLPVDKLQLDSDVDGKTSLANGDHPAESLLRMALAGFAAVGVVLGGAAEAENRARELHFLEGSDLCQVLEQAAALGVDDAGLDEYLVALETEVREELASSPMRGIVTEVAELLWDSGYIGGDHFRAVVRWVTDEWKAANST